MTDTQAPERIWTRPQMKSGFIAYRDKPSPLGDFSEYVHANIHNAVVAERDQLKAKLKALEVHNG